MFELSSIAHASGHSVARGSSAGRPAAGSHLWLVVLGAGLALSLGCSPSTRGPDPSLGEGIFNPRPARPAVQQAESLPDTRVRHLLTYPTRLALGADSSLYVSDARQGSVFVLDPRQRITREISGIPRPLGVVVGPDGTIFVGSGVEQAVRVYDPAGGLLRKIGAGLLLMPNHLALDGAGRLYVADSAANRIQVFEATGALLKTVEGTLSDGTEMRFPVAVAVREAGGAHGGAATELLVADQGGGRVLVLDEQGLLLRQLGERASAFHAAQVGQLARLQSIALGPGGLLHVLDSQLGRVQVFDVETGEVVRSYGELGTAVGRLLLPLDIVISGTGDAVVANAGNGRLERLLSPAAARPGRRP